MKQVTCFGDDTNVISHIADFFSSPSINAAQLSWRARFSGHFKSIIMFRTSHKMVDEHLLNMFNNKLVGNITFATS
jgi:hypothetical protein